MKTTLLALLHRLQFSRRQPNQMAAIAIPRTRNLRRLHQQGMTLIEIMVVIVIIGVLGSALAYGVFGMLGEAREDTAKAQVATVGQAIEAHEARHGEYPGSLQEMTEGKKAKLKPQNLKDPWQQELQYSAQGDSFSLCSNGTDKKSGTEDDVCYGTK